MATEKKRREEKQKKLASMFLPVCQQRNNNLRSNDDRSFFRGRNMGKILYEDKISAKIQHLPKQTFLRCVQPQFLCNENRRVWSLYSIATVAGERKIRRTGNRFTSTRLDIHFNVLSFVRAFKRAHEREDGAIQGRDRFEEIPRCWYHSEGFISDVNENHVSTDEGYVLGFCTGNCCYKILV